MSDSRFICIKLGQRVRETRKQKKLSMEQLSFMADIEYRQLGRVERGEVNTTINTLFKITQAMNIKIQLLFIDIEP